MDKMELIYYEEVDESVTFGAFNFEVHAVEVLEVEFSDDTSSMSDNEENEEKVVIATFAVRIENTSDRDDTFLVNPFALTTNTGEKVNNPNHPSNIMGGDFFGKVWQEGKISFHMTTPVDELEQITLTVDPGYNERQGEIGKEHKLEFDLN